ncbi:MAG TPA: hypothetical protein PLS50_00120 [Candidatus Dojkabacteria bacterium]|nr:hypothetical protein [Candidatus Dojkabacteria bacterium]
MTEYVKMKGKIYWAKVYEPDTAFGASNYKCDFAPENDEEWKKFKDSGIQKTIKEDPERGKYFQLARPDFKLINQAIVKFTGPVIEDKDGKTIVDYINTETGKRIFSYDSKDKDKVSRRGSPIIIGNGSTVEVRVAVYDTFKGKGHRLEGIKVLDLIEFKKEDRPLPELSDLVKKVNKEVEDIEVDEKGDAKKLPW